jgi:secreted PhoX family phosphatase
VGAGFAGLGRWQDLAKAQDAALLKSPKWQALGPLLSDSEGVLDLPAGFTYTVFSRAGETMDDGFFVPTRHDGMAAFPGPDGKTLLVRNHENNPGQLGGPFGPANAKSDQLDAAKIYDAGDGKNMCTGGTTTLLFDTRTQKLEKHWLSLTGTVFNCCGGPTPWGSWISCEENTSRAGAGGVLQQDHGFCFEVPADHEGVVDPVPLADMGRFVHEAVAVDPGSGIV